MEDSPVGKEGVIRVRLRGPELPGEVEVVVAGLAETYVAYAREAVPVGRRVLVLHDRGDRSVDVVPWEVAFPRPQD